MGCRGEGGFVELGAGTKPNPKRFDLGLGGEVCGLIRPLAGITL